jgi:hypothetical protein
MGSETFSDFLIPLKFNLDEPSKKKFDAAISETEKKFAAIDAAAGAAAVALGFVVKEISKNLANLAYAAERVGAFRHFHSPFLCCRGSSSSITTWRTRISSERRSRNAETSFHSRGQVLANDCSGMRRFFSWAALVPCFIVPSPTI